MTYTNSSLLVDVTSGTILYAKDCVILDPSYLPDDADFSDSEIGDIAETYGTPLSVQSQALDALAAFLSTEQWSTDLLDALAEAVRLTGRSVT